MDSGRLFMQVEAAMQQGTAPTCIPCCAAVRSSRVALYRMFGVCPPGGRSKAGRAAGFISTRWVPFTVDLRGKEGCRGGLHMPPVPGGVPVQRLEGESAVRHYGHAINLLSGRLRAARGKSGCTIRGES